MKRLIFIIYIVLGTVVWDVNQHTLTLDNTVTTPNEEMGIRWDLNKPIK